MTKAERIRAYVIKKIAEPARLKGQDGFSVRAGDVHRAMGLSNSMPNVCSALGSKKFEQSADARLARREGPLAGSNVWFSFDFGGAATTMPPDKAAAKNPDAMELATETNTPDISRQEVDFTGAICLVSCVKSKLTSPAPARDLYISAWFQGVRELVEARGVPWYILSALHGLVAPDQVIQPYERTLKSLGAADRRLWAEKVMDDLRPTLVYCSRVLMFAGEAYREHLVSLLRKSGVDVGVPMQGLRLGEQLAWLSQCR